MVEFGFVGMVLCRNSFIDERFRHFWLKGHDFVDFLSRKFSGFMGIVLRIS